MAIEFYGRRQSKGTASSLFCRARRAVERWCRDVLWWVHALRLLPQQWFAASSCLPAGGCEVMSHDGKVSVWREEN